MKEIISDKLRIGLIFACLILIQAQARSNRFDCDNIQHLNPFMT